MEESKVRKTRWKKTMMKDGIEKMCLLWHLFIHCTNTHCHKCDGLTLQTGPLGKSSSGLSLQLCVFVWEKDEGIMGQTHSAWPLYWQQLRPWPTDGVIYAAKREKGRDGAQLWQQAERCSCISIMPQHMVRILALHWVNHEYQQCKSSMYNHK